MSAGLRAAIGPPRWPVTLLTGMLGSGKTTLLRRLLSDPALHGTAILVNEIGEVGLDHHLVERIDGETLLLAGGCLCCKLRADLPRTLSGLRRRWLAEETLDLRRVVIETTGLADPGPILVQLATNPAINADFPLAGVVTTVDSEHASAQLASRPEARRQIAVADQVVLTKTDLVATSAHRTIADMVRGLNPTAALASAAAVTAEAFLSGDFTRGEAIRRWRDDPGPRLPDLLATVTPSLPHGETGIGSLSLRADVPLNWPALEQCLSAIISEFAPDLLRLKGMLDIAGNDRPVVVHAVHDAFYPLDSLAAWPGSDHRSLLVLVVDALGARRDRLVELAGSTGIEWRVVG